MFPGAIVTNYSAVNRQKRDGIPARESVLPGAQGGFEIRNAGYPAMLLRIVAAHGMGGPIGKAGIIQRAVGVTNEQV
jgi:hypothetical protein